MSRVLLVEDNEMNRDMLSRRLRKKGFEVDMALDGAQGVEMARSGAYDIVLMDMSLPVIDGWEATRQLRAAPETQTIPIIALTAHAMSGDRDKAMDAGCSDYDTKPVEIDRRQVFEGVKDVERHPGFRSPETQRAGAAIEHARGIDLGQRRSRGVPDPLQAAGHVEG